MPYYLVIVALQIICVIHVIKTGRNQIWIWVLVRFPPWSFPCRWVAWFAAFS